MVDHPQILLRGIPIMNNIQVIALLLQTVAYQPGQ